MTPLAWTLLALLGTLLVVAAALAATYRRRLHHHLGRDLGDPLPTVPVSEVDARFRQGEFGPTLDAAVRWVGVGDGVPGGTSDREAWILAVLARDARRMFEFGTATGKTAWLWAANSPPDARVTTLTLAPDQHDVYEAAAGDSPADERDALGASRFERFLYDGTPEADKVEQLFGDSKELDVEPWEGAMDLVFVDGSHALSYLESDTANALRMVAPGGLVLWHDYRSPGGRRGAAFHFLNELGRKLPLVRIAGTNLVAYRAPDETAA